MLCLGLVLGSSMECIGHLCPPSLEPLNTPGFVIRAGIIPYVYDSLNGEGQILLGVINRKYTDFGGGCKIKLRESPFQCALREMAEEAGYDIHPNLKNITHIFVSGKKKPHQVILFIQMDDMEEPTLPSQSELDNTALITFDDVFNIPEMRFSDSMRSILPYIKKVIARM